LSTPGLRSVWPFGHSVVIGEVGEASSPYFLSARAKELARTST
jgi:hypothetical protein